MANLRHAESSVLYPFPRSGASAQQEFYQQELLRSQGTFSSPPSTSLRDTVDDDPPLQGATEVTLRERTPLLQVCTDEAVDKTRKVVWNRCYSFGLQRLRSMVQERHQSRPISFCLPRADKKSRGKRKKRKYTASSTSTSAEIFDNSYGWIEGQRELRTFSNDFNEVSFLRNTSDQFNGSRASISTSTTATAHSHRISSRSSFLTSRQHWNAAAWYDSRQDKPPRFPPTWIFRNRVLPRDLEFLLSRKNEKERLSEDSLRQEICRIQNAYRKGNVQLAAQGLFAICSKLETVFFGQYGTMFLALRGADMLVGILCTSPGESSSSHALSERSPSSLANNEFISETSLALSEKRVKYLKSVVKLTIKILVLLCVYHSGFSWYLYDRYPFVIFRLLDLIPTKLGYHSAFLLRIIFFCTGPIIELSKDPLMVQWIKSGDLHLLSVLTPVLFPLLIMRTSEEEDWRMQEAFVNNFKTCRSINSFFLATARRQAMWCTSFFSSFSRMERVVVNNILFLQSFPNVFSGLVDVCKRLSLHSQEAETGQSLGNATTSTADGVFDLFSAEREGSEETNTNLEEEPGSAMEPPLQTTDSSNASSSILHLAHSNNVASRIRSHPSTSVHSRATVLSHLSNRPSRSGSAVVSFSAERSMSSEREESSNAQDSTTAASSALRGAEWGWSTTSESWGIFQEDSEWSDAYLSSQSEPSSRNTFISRWLFGEHRILNRWREKDHCLYRCKDDTQRAIFGNIAPFPLELFSVAPSTELTKRKDKIPKKRRLLEALSLISCMLNSSQFTPSFPCFDETHFLKSVADIFLKFIGKEKSVQMAKMVRPSESGCIRDASFHSCISIHWRKRIPEEESAARPALERSEGTRTDIFPLFSGNCGGTQCREFIMPVPLSCPASAREEPHPLGSLANDIQKEDTTWNCPTTTSDAPLGNAENRLSTDALSLFESNTAATKAILPERILPDLERCGRADVGRKIFSPKMTASLFKSNFFFYSEIGECMLRALIIGDEMLCGEYSYVPYWDTDESISCLNSHFSCFKVKIDNPEVREQIICLLKCLENYWRAKRRQLCDAVAPRISAAGAERKNVDRQVKKQKSDKKKQVLSFSSSSSCSHHEHHVHRDNSVNASRKRSVGDNRRRSHSYWTTSVNSSRTAESHRLPQDWRNDVAEVKRDKDTDSFFITSLTREDVGGMNENQTFSKANEEANQKAYARIIVEELLHSSIPIMERNEGRFTFLPVIERYLQYYSIHLPTQLKENLKEKIYMFDQPFMEAESSLLHSCSTSLQKEDKKAVGRRPRLSTLPPFSMSCSPHPTTKGQVPIISSTPSSDDDSKEKRKVRKRALSCPSFQLCPCECAISRTSHSCCFSPVSDSPVKIGVAAPPDGGSSCAFPPSTQPVFSISKGTKAAALFPYRRCTSESNVQDEIGDIILPGFLRNLSSFNAHRALQTFNTASFCCTPTFYSILSSLLLYHYRNLQVLCHRVAEKQYSLEKSNKTISNSIDTSSFKVKAPSMHCPETRDSLSANCLTKTSPSRDRGLLDQHLQVQAFDTNPGSEPTPSAVTFEEQAKDNAKHPSETADNENSVVSGESINELESQIDADPQLQNLKLNDDAEKKVTSTSVVEKVQKEGIPRDARSNGDESEKPNHPKSNDSEQCTSTVKDGKDDKITPDQFEDVLLNQFYSASIVTNSLLRCLLLSLTPGLRSSANLMYLWQRNAIVKAEQQVKENNQQRKEADFSMHQHQHFSNSRDSQKPGALAPLFSSESETNSLTPLLHVVVHRENLCPFPLRAGVLPSETFREDYLRSRRIEKLSHIAIDLICKYCDEETVGCHDLPKRGNKVDVSKERKKTVHDSPVEISKKTKIQCVDKKPSSKTGNKTNLIKQLGSERNQERSHTCVHCRIQRIVVRLVRKLQGDDQPIARQNASREQHTSFLDRDDFELLRGSKKDFRGKNGEDRAATPAAKVKVKEVMPIDLPTLGPPSCCRISLFDQAIREEDGLASLLPLSETILAEPHKLLFNLLFPIPVNIMSHPSAIGIISTALLLCMREAKMFGGSSGIHRLLRRVKVFEATFYTLNGDEEVKYLRCRCKSRSDPRSDENSKQASKLVAAHHTQAFIHHHNKRVMGTPLAPQSACSSHCQSERKESIPISLRYPFCRDVCNDVDKKGSKKRRSKSLSPSPSSSSSCIAASLHSQHVSRETRSSGPLSLQDGKWDDGRKEKCFFKTFFLLICFWVGNIAASQRIIAHMYLSTEVAFLDYKIVALYLLRILPQYFFSSSRETKM